MSKKAAVNKSSKSFFTYNGRVLTKHLLQKQNAVCTIMEEVNTLACENDPIKVKNTPAVCAPPTSKYAIFNDLFHAVKQKTLARGVYTSKTAATFALAAALVFSLYAYSNLYIQKGPGNTKYAIFSSKPLVIGDYSSRFYGDDSRASTLDRVFEMYNCPIKGLGDVFVEEADKNNIPYWLVASVSFQESNCGKKTPKVSGEESYNAWGWGVWGKNVYQFTCDDKNKWACGIKTVSKYFGSRFYSRGITDTCEIMKTYTPPSNGSWCRGVNYFSDIIQNYEEK